MPQDTEAERDLLVSCLAGSTGTWTRDDAMKMVLTELYPNHFFHPHYKKIFVGLQEAMRDSSGETLSWTDVRDRIHPESVARDMVRDMATSGGGVPINQRRIKRLIQRVDKTYRSRVIYEAVNNVSSKALSGDSDGAFTDLMDLVFSMGRERTQSSAKYIREYLAEVLEEVATRRMKTGGVVGLRTNIKAIDTVWKGLQPENFYLIGGRPGMGKSVVAGQIAYELGKQGIKVLLQTPEMSPRQYITRIACAAAGLDYEKYNGGNYDEYEARLVAEKVEELRELPIIIDGSANPTTQNIRENIIFFQPMVVVVDYLQQVQPARRSENEYFNVTNTSQELNALKKDFGIPIVAAVQLSREVEKREDKEPIPSDLRATGQLEQDADGIFMLYRPVEYAEQDESGNYFITTGEGRNQQRNIVDPELMKFICAKNRHGRRRDVNSYLRDGEMMVSQAPGDEW